MVKFEIILTSKNLYDTIQVTKPWVRLGMGTGGVWSTQNSAYNAYGLTTPTTINGAFDPYRSLYCNPIEWIKNGWIDYVVPQLYWQIGYEPADYNKLVYFASGGQMSANNSLTNCQTINVSISSYLNPSIRL